MPVLPYPTLTFFEPDGTSFDITIDQILGTAVEVDTGRVIGFSQPTYYMVKQDNTKVALSRQSYYTMQNMLTVLVGGTAPIPVSVRSETATLQNTTQTYRTWLTPLVLQPPIPLP